MHHPFCALSNVSFYHAFAFAAWESRASSVVLESKISCPFRCKSASCPCSLRCRKIGSVPLALRVTRSHAPSDYDVLLYADKLETTRNTDTRIWKASLNSHMRAWELYAKQLLILEAALPELRWRISSRVNEIYLPKLFHRYKKQIWRFLMTWYIINY